MTALDSEKVLAHVTKVREITGSALIEAVFGALDDRIRRGEFDLEQADA